jgi:hypothetical protein
MKSDAKVLWGSSSVRSKHGSIAPTPTTKRGGSSVPPQVLTIAVPEKSMDAPEVTPRA